MQHAVHNCATIRVAEKTDVSGRVTADSIKHELYAKKQSSLWRLSIFGFCKVCALAAATFILPALTYADNNRGDDQGDGRPGVPNGTYVLTDSGYFVPPSVPSGQVPEAGAARLTYFANGTLSGVGSFSIGGQVFSGITSAGTFTVNADGSVSETITTSLGNVLHFTAYPTPDGNTIAFVQTDAGSIHNGVATRGR